eukprot:6873149-Alexandrium_andersonii.AAC.1
MGPWAEPKSVSGDRVSAFWRNCPSHWLAQGVRKEISQSLGGTLSLDSALSQNGLSQNGYG